MPGAILGPVSVGFGDDFPVACTDGFAVGGGFGGGGGGGGGAGGGGGGAAGDCSSPPTGGGSLWAGAATSGSTGLWAAGDGVARVDDWGGGLVPISCDLLAGGGGIPGLAGSPPCPGGGAATSGAASGLGASGLIGLAAGDCGAAAAGGGDAGDDARESSPPGDGFGPPCASGLSMGDLPAGTEAGGGEELPALGAAAGCAGVLAGRAEPCAAFGFIFNIPFARS